MTFFRKSSINICALLLKNIYFLSRSKILITKRGITKQKQTNPEILCLSSRHWHLITERNRLGQIYSELPIVAYTEVKPQSLVRAKIPSHIQQQHFGVTNGKGQVTILQNFNPQTILVQTRARWVVCGFIVDIIRMFYFLSSGRLMLT